MEHDNFRGILAVRAQSDSPNLLLNGLNAAFTDFKARHTSEVRALGNEVDLLNKNLAAMRLGGGVGSDVDHRDHTEVNAALRRFIRTGDETAKASLLGIRAGMSTGSDPDGGFTVVPFLSPTMTSRLLAISPMRQLARVETIVSDAFEEIADTGSAGAAWAAESEARGDTASPTLHKLSVPVHEISAMPKVTQRLLDDSSFDLAAWLTGNIARSFSKLEGAAFVSGDGVGKPRGLLTYATADAADDLREWGTLQTVPSGAAAAIVEDSLLDVVYSLRPEYRAGASWLMSRQTAAAVRKLKDSTGRFFWAESLAAGEPPRLLGFPVALDEEMPNVAAGALPIAFGDFAQGYLIVDRLGLRLLRDPFTDKPNVKFYTTKRVGGAVFGSEAIKLLRIGV